MSFIAPEDVSTKKLLEAQALMRDVLERRDADIALEIVAQCLKDITEWLQQHRSAS